MSGYFQDRKSTRAVLDKNGWLATGDIGYYVEDHIFITARCKDVIIIKGRNIWPYDMEVVTQHVEGVRPGGVAAFSVTGLGAEEIAVMVVETRLKDPHLRSRMSRQITAAIHKHFGINVIIDLVKTGSLPRTTSGKLSRFQSRQAFMDRRQVPALQLADTTEIYRRIA